MPLYGEGVAILKNEKRVSKCNFITFALRTVAKLFVSKKNLSKEWWNENT